MALENCLKAGKDGLPIHEMPPRLEDLFTSTEVLFYLGLK